MRSKRLAQLLAGALLLAAAGCSSISTRVHMNEGHKLYKAQRYDEAIEEYKKILVIDPDNWGANYQIAMSNLALYHPGSTHPKDVEYANKSIAAFEILLKLEAPDGETAEKVHNYYVALLRSAERTEKAVAYYEDLLAKDPRSTLLIGQLAEIYAKSGDFPNALKYYEKRTEVDPDSKEGWYTVGVICWERSYRGGPLVSDEEREEVIAKGMAALEKALEIDSDYFEALAYMKLLYLEKSKVLAAQQKNIEAGDAYAKADEYQARILELNARRKAEAAASGKEGG